jgi:Lon-like ATP-dependent protease
LNHFITQLFASAMHRFAEKGQVAALERTLLTLIRYLQKKPGEMHTLLDHFAVDSRWVLRYAAGREAYRLLDQNPEKVLKTWLLLADDHRLYVREGVAKGLVKAAEDDFDLALKFCMDAFDHASDRIRQTAAMPLIHWSSRPDLLPKLHPFIRRVRKDSSEKVKMIYKNQIAPLLNEEELLPVQMKEYESTEELPISTKLIDQVVGQVEAVATIRLAAHQKRSVLLVGEPGTGKSMLGKALAELLPSSTLEDVLVEAGPRERNVPSIRVLPAGKGQHIITENEREFHASLSTLRWVLGFASAVSLFVAFFYAITRDSPSYIVGGLFVVGLIYWFSKSMKAKPSEKIPKYLVNNTGRTQAPFVEGTGLHAGALLGDVRHDPYQSGGLEASPHHLVEPGAIHLAHKGVLFIDEVSTLSLESQQSLLTAFQEKKLTITGRSTGSSGTMIRTEPIPSDFVMVMAGNLPDVDKIHPALRSRIRGYGYEVYMNDTMADTEENRFKLALFITQEIRKDGKIPHFTRKAVDLVIERAQLMSNHPDRLTARFRELGGLIRAAGDLAVQSNSVLVHPEHVQKALRASRTLEEQIFAREREYGQPFHSSPYPGRVKAISIYKNTLGQVVQVWADVQSSDGVEIQLSREWAQKLNVLPVEAALSRDQRHGKYYVEIEENDQNLQPDDLALAVAVSAWSVKQGIVLPEDMAICGVLNVAGVIRETPSFERKVQAAKESGIKTIIAPMSNRSDSLLRENADGSLHFIWVNTLDEIWEALK